MTIENHTPRCHVSCHAEPPHDKKIVFTVPYCSHRIDSTSMKLTTIFWILVWIVPAWAFLSPRGHTSRPPCGHTRLAASVQSVQIRGIDPSETCISVGDTVVAATDLPAYHMWQFESYVVQAIYDTDPAGQHVAMVSTLDTPIPDNRARHVTLTGSRLRTPITLRLAGLYSHGMSTLWILDNQL